MNKNSNVALTRISRVTIARLHNRGNYEHSRYEVTVEIPAGVDPGSVMSEVDDALNDLQPKSPVDAWTLSQQLKRLQLSPCPTDIHDASEREYAQSHILKHEEWKRRNDAAYKRFTELGGTERFSDAKAGWADDEQH